MSDIYLYAGEAVAKDIKLRGTIAVGGWIVEFK